MQGPHLVMPQYCKGLLFALLSCLAHPCQASAQNPPVVRRIEIVSTWSDFGMVEKIHKESPGRGQSSRTDLSIRRDGDTYYLNDKIVDASLVAALASALQAPANRELSLDDLGVTPSWLEEHASSAAQHLAETRIINGAPPHLSMLEAAFADPVTMDRVVPTLFEESHYRCVDCKHYRPYVEIVVTFEDFSSLKATSTSQFPFLLPWHEAGKNTNAIAYNAGISRALAALMPENSTNRTRLSGETLARALAEAVFPQVEHGAQLLDIEAKTGGTFAALRARYTLESARINNYGDPELRVPEAKAVQAPEEPSLAMLLSAPDLPFQEEVVLQYRNGNVFGTDKFLQDGPQFEKLVASVPWLRQYAQEHPKVRLRLTYFRGASFSDSAMKVFAADMQAIGRDKWIPEAESAKDRIAVLVAGFGAEESDWLVFPDRHMILWRFFQVPVYGKTDLLKWQPSDFSTKPCAYLKTNLAGCVGAKISPDGVLQPYE
jgi:hypothetical protein